MSDQEYRVVRGVETFNPNERVPRVVPVGPMARAVRIIRENQPSVVLPLVTTREYQVGRSRKADLYFDDESISRLHGCLDYCPTAIAWTYLDKASSNGSSLYQTGAKPKARLLPGVAVGIIGGYTLALGRSKTSRLEFLADLPPDALGASTSTHWKSPAAMKLEQEVQLAARHLLPLFLLGPSGSGKTFVANRIHHLSQRKGDYVDINCGHLSGDRIHLASELVGHVKGAFTGAGEARQGKLFQADGGTLFLDEVESLVPEAQVFLLNLLEGKGDLLPLGAPAAKGRPRPKFRLITASKKRLEESELRRDLAQRLAGEIIIVPSLAGRREDIPALVALVLEEIAAEQQLHAELSQDALAYLTDQPWPGEVRELLTTVRVVANRRWAEQLNDGLESRSLVLGVQEFAVYLSERRDAFGAAKPAEAKSSVQGPRVERRRTVPEAATTRKRPGDLTRGEVESALRAAGGNKTHAAYALGLAFNTLKKKMAEFGL